MALLCCGVVRQSAPLKSRCFAPPLLELIKSHRKSTSAKLLSTSSGCRQGESGERGFLSKLLNLNTGSTLAPLTAPHSKVLTEGDIVYELQFHYVKPDCVDEYKGNVASAFEKAHENSDYPGRLVGSWLTQFGELDQAVHMWKYAGGYEAVAKAKEMHVTGEVSGKEHIKLLRRRESHLLHAFHFWGEPQDRKPEHIYELRSYSLKPGTMIEWGNNWGQAIKIRQQDAVGGFFSQLGDLYQVHHIWAYTDLFHRKEAREIMWQEPGWDDCVANTVPLVNKMESRLLVPLPFSPLQ